MRFLVAILLTVFVLMAESLTSEEDKKAADILNGALNDQTMQMNDDDDPWDLNAPCQKAVEQLSIAQAKVVQCVSNNSLPPTVCISCFQEYSTFKHIEYTTMHLSEKSRDNRSCSDVIYGGYLLSYSRDISNALTDQIWEQSRCSSCLNLTIDYAHNATTYSLLKRTTIWMDKKIAWEDCVDNVTFGELTYENGSVICTACKAKMEDLFDFYWKIYITPDIDFCVDIETMMNDTMHLWNDVWGCAETKDRQKDRAMVIVTLVILIIFTLLFYSASYIQGEGKRRTFVLYSGMPVTPGSQRHRLLSTSASSSDLQAMSISPTPISTPIFTVPVHRR